MLSGMEDLKDALPGSFKTTGTMPNEYYITVEPNVALVHGCSWVPRAIARGGSASIDGNAWKLSPLSILQPLQYHPLPTQGRSMDPYIYSDLKELNKAIIFVWTPWTPILADITLKLKNFSKLDAHNGF